MRVRVRVGFEKEEGGWLLLWGYVAVCISLQDII